MANLQGNGPTNEYSNRPLPVSRSSNSWMIPVAVLAVIIVLGVGYGYENGWMNSASVTEHKAAATGSPAPMQATTAPTTAPAAPAATPKP
jgi:hypothetical protein